MKKNGFTLIELIVCFALVTVLSMSIFKTVLSMQQNQVKNISYNSYLSFVSVMNNTIQNDFLFLTISNVSSCNTNCYDITYVNKGVVRLQVDRINNTITYDGETEELPTGYKLYKDISLLNFSTITTSNYDSYYLLRIPIKGDLFPNMEDIKYTHLYSSDENNLPKHILHLDLDGGTLETSNFFTPAGTIINLPNPSKPMSIFTGWQMKNGTGTLSGNTFTMGNGGAEIIANWINSVEEFEYIAPTDENANPHYIYPIYQTGYYMIELWGAQGPMTNPGLGAYTKGKILLNEGDVLNIYIGGKGLETESGYNGGGAGMNVNTLGANWGGGASDVRINGTSLKDRIMVAGGGGGGTVTNIGHAGGLVGYQAYSPSYTSYCATGGTQINGGTVANYSSTYLPGTNGEFGIGGTGGGAGLSDAGHGGSPGGGGGYYGGAGGSRLVAGSFPSGGGSSYISGHQGCIAVNDTDPLTTKCTVTVTNIVPTTTDYVNIGKLCSEHFSGKIFEETLMIDGAGYTWTNKREASVGTNLMPNPTGGTYASGKGNSENGYGKIRFIEEQ